MPSSAPGIGARAADGWPRGGVGGRRTGAWMTVSSPPDGSPHHVVTCAGCAELCRACEEACRSVSGDDRMVHCAEICAACADSCERMAGGGSEEEAEEDDES